MGSLSLPEKLLTKARGSFAPCYCPELLTWQGGVSIRTIAFRLWVKYVLRSQSVLVVHYSCNIHVPTISRVSCDFHTPFQW